MKIKSKTLGFASATITAVVTPILLGSTSPILSQSNPEDRVTFSCKNVFDRASGQNLPTTIAWVPQRLENVPIIQWKSKFFEGTGWTPQKRCDTVSPKFQTFYDDGRLNYLSNGKNGAYPVICALTSKDESKESCNGDNQLFTLKREHDGSNAIEHLIDLLSGDGGNSMLVQNSEDKSKVFISIKDLLMNAPAIED